MLKTGSLAADIDLAITISTFQENTAPDTVRKLMELVVQAQTELRKQDADRYLIRCWSAAYWRLKGIEGMREIRAEAKERRRLAALDKRRKQRVKAARQNKRSRQTPKTGKGRK